MKRNLLLKFWLLFFLSVLFTNKAAIAQATDATGFFQPGLTNVHLVYAELSLVDADSDGNFDASFTLSQDTVVAWGDYSVSVAFYDEGFLIRDGGGFFSTNVVIPVVGQLCKFWFALNVPAKKYKAWVQTESMDSPILILEKEAAFRNTNITAINRWSCLHNPNTEPDYVTVQKVELITNSDPTLKSLSTNIGTLNPEFDPETIDYELTVPYGTNKIQFNAVPNGMAATITYFDGKGNKIENGLVTFSGDGIDIEVNVLALDGSTELSYYVAIFLDNSTEASTLSSIELSTGVLTTDFIPDVTEYTVIVPLGTTTVELSGIPTWEGASVSGGGTVTITNGSATSTITVISEDGKHTRTYTINFYESKVGATGAFYYIQHEVSELVIGESGESPNYIKLYQALKGETTQLFQLEESGIEGQYFLKNQASGYLTLSTSNTWNMVMTSNLTTNPDSCRFEIIQFEPGRFHIRSVIKDETTVMGTDANTIGSGIYSDKKKDNVRAVWNIRPPEEVVSPYDTYLSALSVNTGRLSPSFNIFITNYYLSIPMGTSSVTVNATPNDPGSTISGLGTFDVSDGQGTIKITVTASEPSYTQDYYIHYQTETDLTLMHSYTFADGTAQDRIGNAHGIVTGGSISNGMYKAATPGDYIKLPGTEIALNSYPSITLEAYIEAGNGVNTGNTMLCFFGNTTSAYGTDYLYLTAANGGKSRAAISIGNPTSPWSQESGVDGILLDDGFAHHIVSTLTYDTITWYIDGVLAGKTNLSDTNLSPLLNNTYAYLCKSGYTNDPTWLGSFYEFNIYKGLMDEQTITLHFIDFPVDDENTNATLSDLFVDGEPVPGFSPYQLNYPVQLPTGTTNAPVVTATTKNIGANAVVTNANGIPGSASVLVTAADGVTQNTYSLDFTVELGNSLVEKKSIRVFPTLSNDCFTVETTGGISTISMYNMLGKLLNKTTSDLTSTTITAPQPGIYLLIVENRNTIVKFKVIKTD